MGLLFGLTMPLRAMKLILQSRALLGLSAAPVICTLAAYGFALAWLGELAHRETTRLIHERLPSTWEALPWMVTGATWALLALIAVASFSTVATLFAAPFNDFLAEAAEPRVLPALDSTGTPSLRVRAKLISIDLLKTLFGGGVTLFAIFISWIPALNVLSLPLTWVMVCFQFISYPQTRRGQGIGDGLRFISTYPGACLGFGAVFSVLFAIPVVGCLALPLAVVGGTQLFARSKPVRPIGPA
jgi:uncharacterized protein involved in cysteine biosynthesis